MEKRIIGIRRDQNFFKVEYNIPESPDEAIQMMKENPKHYYRCFLRGLHLIEQSLGVEDREVFDPKEYQKLLDNGVTPEVAQRAAVRIVKPQIISEKEYLRIKSAPRYDISGTDEKKFLKATRKSSKKKKTAKKKK